MFKVKNENNITYISFEKEYLSKDVIGKLKNFVEKVITSKAVAVYLSGVESVQNDFFSLLKKFSTRKNFALYNVGVDINMLINLMNYRQQLKMYLNKEDCAKKKNELVNRKFKLCN